MTNLFFKFSGKRNNNKILGKTFKTWPLDVLLESFYTINTKQIVGSIGALEMAGIVVFHIFDIQCTSYRRNEDFRQLNIGRKKVL